MDNPKLASNSKNAVTYKVLWGDAMSDLEAAVNYQVLKNCAIPQGGVSRALDDAGKLFYIQAILLPRGIAAVAQNKLDAFKGAN